MDPSWLCPMGGGGDGQWEDGAEVPWEKRPGSVGIKRDQRRRRAREPSELSPESESSQKRIRRENQRQRSLHMACTLMSVTSLTPSCGPDLLLTQYQRLSQLVRYTAFLEDATSALVRELGVRLNFDFSPVTRYMRRLRYQSLTRNDPFDFPADEAEELMKLLDTMTAGGGEQQQQTAASGWKHRNAASTSASRLSVPLSQLPQPPQSQAQPSQLPQPRAQLSQPRAQPPQPQAQTPQPRAQLPQPHAQPSQSQSQPEDSSTCIFILPH